MKLFYVFLIIITISIGNAQTLYEKQIIPFDGVNYNTFGSAVAVEDSFLFISSPHRNSSSGEVYVYKLIEGDYIYSTKITASDGQIQDLFGTKLLYDNNKLFICAINKRVNNFMNGPGAVYVFINENGSWIEKQIILPPEPYTFGGSFSSSISKYGDYLIIGAEEWNSTVANTGKAFVYKNNNDNYQLYQILQPTDAFKYQKFGSSVIINDSLIVVGSSGDSTQSGIFSGSVYIYSKADPDWEFIRKYSPEPNSNFLSLGTSISFNNEYVFVGTSANTNYAKAGQVYIYKYPSSRLELSQVINTGDHYFNDRFGISLYAKGDSLLVGALFDTVKSYDSGTAYLFTNENGNWIKKHKIVPSDEYDAFYFGYSCALSENLIAIGAPESKYNGLFLGKTYLYSNEPLDVMDIFIDDLNAFHLSQNYPNPFNPSTIIRFDIKESGLVKIKVYDILGREIVELVNENKEAGYHSIEFSASNLPSGVYIYSLQVNGYSASKKMLLLK